jgi:hypothetical protein
VRCGFHTTPAQRAFLLELDMYHYYSTDPVYDAERYYAALDAESSAYHAAMQCAIERLESETVEQVKKGNFERLWDAIGYRDCDTVVFKALVACADKGDPDAIAALKCLTHTYAELNAEMKE